MPDRPSEPATASPGTGGPAPGLLAALRRLLRPLVQFLLTQQFQYPMLAAVLKELYVEVADREFPLKGKSQTDSRVSLLSGVHRKEVRRLRSEPPEEDVPPASVTIGAQLVLLWTSSPEFQTADGRARPLPRTSDEKHEPSFEKLVVSVSKDIRPRSVLDEWLRLGVAHVDEDGRVCLNTEAFVPVRGFEEKAFYFGRNLRDHIASATHNLTGGDPPLFERSVYYGGLSEESARELQTLASELGMEALQTVNRRASTLKKRDARRGGLRERITLGIYFFRGKTEGERDRDANES